MDIKKLMQVLPQAFKLARIQAVNSLDDDRRILEDLLEAEKELTKLVIKERKEKEEEGNHE